jgi:hypothetical protein
MPSRRDFLMPRRVSALLGERLDSAGKLRESAHA